MSIDYKFNEDKLVKELQEYINKTYSEHYSEDNKIQTTEYIMDQCDTPDFIRGNILKYAARYGRKEGYNKKDVMKILHYAIMLLYYHESRFGEVKTSDKEAEKIILNEEPIIPRKVELINGEIYVDGQLRPIETINSSNGVWWYQDDNMIKESLDRHRII